MLNAKILVVDDEPDLQSLILQKFRTKIKQKEYGFQFANNGAEALEKIANDRSIDLILTDINMPVMDGLTLLAKINELNNRMLRAIIVSAYGDMENIRTAMNRGAYDFITKPINLNDLEITIEKSLKEIEYNKLAIIDRDKLIAFKQELNIATVIQTSMLPKGFPAFPERDDFDIYARMLPAKEVGGDLYDYFLIDNNKLGVIIGDVSGKGIASALLMAVCKTLLKSTAYKGMPVDKVLYEVNNILVEEIPQSMFVTVFYGVLDTVNGKFEYSNGGHNSPYKIFNDGKIEQLEKVGGSVLGVVKDGSYKSKIIDINPGEVILLYTDGITEAFNKDEEEFEEKRLEDILREKCGESVHDIVECVIARIKEYTVFTEQSDDITCEALKYLKKLNP